MKTVNTNNLIAVTFRNTRHSNQIYPGGLFCFILLSVISKITTSVVCSVGELFSSNPLAVLLYLFIIVFSEM